MNRANMQQEVLFCTGTSFTQKELIAFGSFGNMAASVTDKLENAFWNGMLFEMLPELKSKNAETDQMYLWQVYNYGSLMRITLCNIPEPLQSRYSLDPYLFLETYSVN